MSKKTKAEEEAIRLMNLNNQILLDRRRSLKTVVSGDAATSSGGGGGGGGGSQTDTTSDDKQAFLIIGDSMAGDTSSSLSVGPTTPAGTTYLWNGSGLTELTTADINKASATAGTPWKKFALDYNAATGKKCVFVNGAAGGSSYASDSGPNNWSTTGNLYAPCVTDANNCLSFLGLTRFKGIFVILGANDGIGSIDISLVIAAIDDLMIRINSDFNSVPVYVTTSGGQAGGAMNDRFFDIKTAQKQTSVTYSNIHVAINLAPFRDWGLLAADVRHQSQAGNNKIGEMFSRYIMATEPDKQIKQIQNSFFNDLSANNKAALKTFVNGNIADGNWALIDSFQWYYPSDVRDKVMDWTLLTAAIRKGNVTGDGSNFLKTDGVAGTAVDTNFAATFATIASQNDAILGVRTGIVTTAVGTGFHLHSAGSNSVLRSTTSNTVIYQFNNASSDTWTAGDTQFQNNTDYARDRTSSTAFHLFKNGTQVDTGSQASTTPDFLTLRIGANASDQLPGVTEVIYHFFARRSGFNYSAFLAREATLRASWV